MMTLWQRLHIDLKSLLSWQYLTRDIMQIRSWNITMVGIKGNINSKTLKTLLTNQLLAMYLEFLGRFFKFGFVFALFPWITSQL